MSSDEKRRAAARIKKGGVIADEIRKEADAHHALHEIPEAESSLEKGLQEVMETESQKKKEEELLIPDEPPTPSKTWVDVLHAFFRQLF